MAHTKGCERHKFYRVCVFFSPLLSLLCSSPPLLSTHCSLLLQTAPSCSPPVFFCIPLWHFLSAVFPPHYSLYLSSFFLPLSSRWSELLGLTYMTDATVVTAFSLTLFFIPRKISFRSWSLWSPVPDTDPNETTRLPLTSPTTPENSENSSQSDEDKKGNKESKYILDTNTVFQLPWVSVREVME